MTHRLTRRGGGEFSEKLVAEISEFAITAPDVIFISSATIAIVLAVVLHRIGTAISIANGSIGFAIGVYPTTLSLAHVRYGNRVRHRDAHGRTVRRV
jgi:hypothetical protein